MQIKEVFDTKTPKGGPSKEGQEVEVRGWVYDSRDLSKVRFIVLRDTSGRVQVTGINGETDEKIFESMKSISRESVIRVKGKIQDNKQAPNGKEILPTEIEIITVADLNLPIDVSDHSKTELPKRLDYRFLDTRRKQIAPIFKVRSSIYKNIVDFFGKNEFLIMNTPKLTTIGLESGAESFEVKYFNKKASLAQSPQFYKQMFIMGGFRRVMEIGQVYRAEKSHTTRHLTEFTGVDFEMEIQKDENDVMDMVESMLKHIITNVKEECVDELKEREIELKVPKKIPRVSMEELKKMLAKKGKKLSGNDDLDAEAETMVGEYALEKYGEEFIFVTNYPWDVRPFYHMKPENDKNGTRSFDLLWRGVEIATGAQREHRFEVLEAQAKEKGMKLDTIYGEIFKFGAVPHGGVGFGLDRITQRMLNLDNVREALLLPRDTERVTP